MKAKKEKFSTEESAAAAPTNQWEVLKPQSVQLIDQLMAINQPPACFCFSLFFFFSSYYIFCLPRFFGCLYFSLYLSFSSLAIKSFLFSCLMQSRRCWCGLDWDEARQNKHTSSWSQDLQIPVGCNSNLTQRYNTRYQRKVTARQCFHFTGLCFIGKDILTSIVRKNENKSFIISERGQP